MRHSIWSRLMVGLLAVTISACAAVTASRKAEEERQQAVVQRMDIAHIYVTPGDPPPGKPFQELGALTYSEPFSADAIDTHKQESKLKKMALDKYPDDVDAIIMVHSDVNDKGDTVTVTAKAIKYESSVDRNAMHKMNEGMVASPKE